MLPTRGLPPFLVARDEVEPGAEVLTVAGEQDGADRFVAPGEIDRVDRGVHHRVVDRVALLRTRQAQREHPRVERERRAREPTRSRSSARERVADGDQRGLEVAGPPGGSGRRTGPWSRLGQQDGRGAGGGDGAALVGGRELEVDRGAVAVGEVLPDDRCR